MQSYGLDEHQHDLVTDFFLRHKNVETNLLSVRLLKELMVENLARNASRKELKASQEDVQRALETVDSDKDELINLSQFLALLLLFYASQHNLEERLKLVLSNLGSIELGDSNEFAAYLRQFYGSQSYSEDLYDSLSRDELANRLASQFEDALFIKWSREGDETKSEC
jgi:hypothetical protein